MMDREIYHTVTDAKQFISISLHLPPPPPKQKNYEKYALSFPVNGKYCYLLFFSLSRCCSFLSRAVKHAADLDFCLAVIRMEL